jgi:CheY-like chemotaxis protein
MAAWNGKEALNYLTAAQQGMQIKPDIILMDVQMPVIRQHSPYNAYVKDVPIVAMTASAIQGDREKCMRAGMDDYLAKPVKSKTLERMLIRWTLSRRRPPSSQDHEPFVSDCSESGEHCSRVEIPVVGVDKYESSGGASAQNPYASLEGDPSLSTPRPSARGADDRYEPFGPPIPVLSVQTSREAGADELALHLQTEKLLDAAGGASMTRAASYQRDQPSKELTEENVGRLEKEGALQRRG